MYVVMRKRCIFTVLDTVASGCELPNWRLSDMTLSLLNVVIEGRRLPLLIMCDCTGLSIIMAITRVNEVTAIFTRDFI